MKRTDPVLRRYLAVGPLYLPIATIVVHIIGSMVLDVATGGFGGILAAPILAIFGLVVLPVELLAVTLQWYLYYALSFSKRAFRMLFVVSAVLVPALVAILGPKEENSEVQWAVGFGIGAAVAGISTLLALRWIVRAISKSLERGIPATSE